jgi:hypothetical protein
MSKSKTAPKLTKGAKRGARKPARPGKARAKKATARAATVSHPPRSGKASSSTQILEALQEAFEGPLGTEVEEIAEEARTIDLIITPKGGPLVLCETKAPRSGAAEAASPWPVSNIAVELIPRGEGKDFRYELAYPDPAGLRASTSELADRMLPDAAIPTPSQALLARGESRQRWSLLQEFGGLSSEEIADHLSRAKNRHAMANRLRTDGKIFSVPVRGRRVYPGFQFDSETFAPEPLVARVLAALPRAEMSEWETALWWVAADPHLQGRRPVDLMHTDPERVLEAAAALARPIAL